MCHMKSMGTGLFDNFRLLGRGSREQELIIFSARERQLSRRKALVCGIRATGCGNGQRAEIDLGADPAFLADMPEVAGEAVRKINSGRGEFLIAQPLPFLNTGGRTEMALNKSLAVSRAQGSNRTSGFFLGRGAHEQLEPGQRISQSSCDINVIADAGSSTEEGPAGWCSAKEGNIHKESGSRSRCVASDQCDMMRTASFQEAGIQAENVFACESLWNSE